MTQPQIQVRQPMENDGQCGTCIIRRSILELCSEELGNDERAIQEWMSDKTVEAWKA